MAQSPRFALRPRSPGALCSRDGHYWPPRTDPDVPKLRHPALLRRVFGGDTPRFRGLPYAAQRLGHTCPALGPVRALLVRVPLGPRPWLHRLRRRLPALFGRFMLLWRNRLFSFVHRRLGSSPSRRGPRPSCPGRPEISRFPYKERPHMPGSTTTPGRQALA